MRPFISVLRPRALPDQLQLHPDPMQTCLIERSNRPRRALSGGLGVSVGWSLAGSATYAVCQWGTLVLLAKLASAEDVGRYAFALAVSAPIMMFLQLQLRTVQVTDTAGRLQFADYLGLRSATSVIGIGAVLAVAAVSRPPAGSLALIALVACIKALDGLSDIFFGEWQKRERMDIPARLQMLNGALSLTLLAAALFAGWPVAAAIGGSLAGSIATVAAAAFLSRQDLDGGFVPGAGAAGRMRSLVWLALPLGLVMALISLTSNIPRYFIETYLGTRELGIFAALIYVTTAGMTLVSAIGNSLTPRLARAFGNDRRGFVRLVAVFVAAAAAVGTAGVIAALVAGERLLLIAYGPAYAAAADLFIGVMMFGTLSYMASAIGFAMSAARCFRAQAPLFVAVTAAILAGSAMWIPGRGTRGAVAALTLGAVVQLLGGAAVLFAAVRRPAVGG